MKRKHQSIAHAAGKGPRLVALWALVLLFGCQTLSLDPRGRFVPEEKRIALPESGEQPGVFQNEDLTVSYKMVRGPGQLRISGEIQFADRITKSFPMIAYFHLAAILIDAEGKVLSIPGLATEAGYRTSYAAFPDHPAAFDTTIPITDNTASIAFSYTGKAYEGGDPEGGSMDFWEYPVY